jgi:hypothetical protein
MPNIIRKIRNKDLYKVFNKDTGVVHSYGSTLENAKSQVRLLDAIEGSGLATDITKGVNQVVNKISKIGKKTGKFIEKVINPSDFLPPSLKRVLQDHGEEVITQLTLRRNPVSSLITGAMNAVSSGTFYENMKNQPYDKLFHLGLVVSTANTRFVLEKIERVNVSYSISKPEGLEELDISVPDNLTVRNLIDNTLNKMGKQRFLGYDGYKNNCQDFIMNVLQSNDIVNSENSNFVKQDTQVLFKDSPLLSKVSKKLTDIGASFNVLTRGGGINENVPENKIYPNNITMDFQYLLPQKEIQHKNQLVNISKNTYDYPQPLQAGQGSSMKGRGVGKTLNKISKGVRSVNNHIKSVENAIDMMKNVPSSARSHLKSVGLDIAEILVKKGVPVTAGTIAGVLGTMAGGPALGVASSVGTSYLTGMAMNELAKKEGIDGSGLYAGGGLYAGSQGKGYDSSDDEEECCEMCGGKLLVDRKFSVRDVYNAAKSVPKVYKQNVKSLQEGGTIRERMGSDSSTYTPKRLMDGSGVKKPKMLKGSPEMREHMARLREMRKKK